MRIPDADPGDQNHADSCGCGSATLPKTVRKGLTMDTRLVALGSCSPPVLAGLYIGTSQVGGLE